MGASRGAQQSCTSCEPRKGRMNEYYSSWHHACMLLLLEVPPRVAPRPATRSSRSISTVANAREEMVCTCRGATSNMTLQKLALRRCPPHCMESKLHEIPLEICEICKPCCSFQSRMEPYQFSCSFLQMLWNAFMLRVRDMQTLLFVSVTHGTLSVQLFVSTDAVEPIYASCARYANLVVRFRHAWNPISSVVRFYSCCGTHICFVCEICKPCCAFQSSMEPYQSVNQLFVSTKTFLTKKRFV